MSRASSANANGWSGFDLAIKSHSGRFGLSEDYVRERIKHISSMPKVTVLVETERLFIWRDGRGLFAYVHESLVR